MISKQTFVTNLNCRTCRALLVSAIALLGTGARADNALAPGQSKIPLAGVTLAQQPDLAGGTTLKDVTQTFDVSSATDHLKGNARMIARKAASGRTVFEYIITSDPASTGSIIYAHMTGDMFSTWPLDVAYRVDAPGQIAPTGAERGDTGADIQFDFRNFALKPGTTSKMFFIALKSSNADNPPQWGATFLMYMSAAKPGGKAVTVQLRAMKPSIRYSGK